VYLEMRNVECGMRNGTLSLTARAPSTLPDLTLQFRIPHSAFRILFIRVSV